MHAFTYLTGILLDLELRDKNEFTLKIFFHFQRQISHKLANQRSQCEICTKKAQIHEKTVVVFVFV